MRKIAWLLILLSLTLAAPAAAEVPSNEDRRLATEYFEAGAKAYFGKNYARAIVEFKKAYAHVEDPLILYNVCLAYLKLGNIPDALAAARSTARDAERLPADDRPRFDGRWAGLGRANQAIEFAEQANAANAASAASVATAQPPARVETVRFGALGGVGVGLSAAGVGTLVSAAIFDSTMSADLGSYRKAAREGDTQRYAELKQKLERRQQTVKVLLGVGSAATVVGVLLLAVDLVTVTERAIPMVSLVRGSPTFGFVLTY